MISLYLEAVHGPIKICNRDTRLFISIKSFCGYRAEMIVLIVTILAFLGEAALGVTDQRVQKKSSHRAQNNCKISEKWIKYTLDYLDLSPNFMNPDKFADNVMLKFARGLKILYRRFLFGRGQILGNNCSMHPLIF